MDFEWTDEERTTKQAVADALGAAGPPDALEEAGTPRLSELVRGFLRALAPSGYLALAQDEAGRTDVLRLMAGQLEVARASGSLHLAVEASARLYGSLAAGLADPAARAAALEPVRRGEAVGATALSDPPEAEQAAPGVAARREGQAFVLSGRKPFVTNAPFADRFAVAAATEAGEPVVAFVEAGAAGLGVGDRLRTMGQGGLAVAPLELDRVRVPESLVALGPAADAALLERARTLEAIALTTASVGLMQRVLEAARSHARAHRRGGRPIFKWQEVSFRLAEMLTLTQTAELMAYRAGWLHGTGDPEAATVVECAKVFSSEKAETVASMAVQVLGGQGFLFGNVVERSYRDARYAQVAGRPSEPCRMAIADAVLARYR